MIEDILLIMLYVVVGGIGLGIILTVIVVIWTFSVNTGKMIIDADNDLANFTVGSIFIAATLAILYAIGKWIFSTWA